MAETLRSLAEGVRNGIVAPFFLSAQNAEMRFYWAYLILVPGILVLMKWRGGPAAATIDRVFARKTWLGVSARVDIWMFVINSILRFSVLSGLFLSAAAVAAIVSKCLTAWGVPLLLTGAGFAAVALLTVAAFIAADFAKFLVHYLAHRIPALWELHKVHHAAEALNPFTAERFHPLEQIFDAALIGLVLGATNGLFMALAGPSLTAWEIAGANIFWFAANLAGGPLRHMPVWLSYGPGIERWILSPAQHQIHHSDDQKHFDKNLGSTLALWDWMIGTLYVTRGVEDIRYGLGVESARFRTVSENYWRPLMAMWALKRGGHTPPQPAPAL